MKLKIYILVFSLFYLIGGLHAQDKVIFKDGRKLHCKILAINPNTITYKDSANADKMITVAKNDVLMAEYKSGSVYIFGNTTSTPSNSIVNKPRDRKAEIREREKTFANNIIGIQIPDLAFGRLTLSYERLFFDKQIGVAVPLSMSFDRRILSLASANTSSSSSTSSSSNGTTTSTSSQSDKIRTNLGFITGFDVNYYFESRSHTRFFIGPRVRYGTDVTMQNITAYSVQCQNGILIGSRSGKLASTLAIGFGFVRIIASPFGNGINPNQSYPWASFTFRLGFRA